MDRRQFLVGAAAGAALPLIPTVVASAPVAPAVLHPVWAVGTEEGRNWDLFRAPSREDAIEMWRSQTGNYGFTGDCDCDGEDGERCDDCADPEAQRIKGLDDKLESIGPNEARHIAGWMGRCERCRWDECNPCDYHVLPDDELVCTDCMQLADWRIEDPQYYEELCDELLTEEYGPDLRFPEYW